MTIAGESDQGGFWARLWKNPAIRYVFLAPTVLTTIANVQEIGRMARWITSEWRPLLQKLELQVTHLLPNMSFPARGLVIVLFFFPFVLTGAVQLAMNPRRTMSPAVALLACLAYAVVLHLVTITNGDAGFAINVFIGLAIVVVLCSLVHRWFTGKWDVYVIVVPCAIIVLILLTGAMAIHADAARGAMVDRDYLGLLLLPFILALPLLNPRRLIDVGALSLGIIAISYFADFAERAAKGFLGA
jgi:hypothetical protein